MAAVLECASAEFSLQTCFHLEEGGVRDSQLPPPQIFKYLPTPGAHGRQAAYLETCIFPSRPVAPPNSRSLELFELSAFRGFGCICDEKISRKVNLK